MDATNQTIRSAINKGFDYVSFLSRKLTENIINFLKEKGVSVTPRWAGLLVMFLSFLFFYVGLKISKPIAKWSMIALAILLILGLIIPFW